MLLEKAMTSAMDSPDHNPIMPSSDIQGSPFFHFLCSLSPIKPDKIGHGAQTFSELSFPPPTAVFVSPKAEENQKNSARSKRRILAGETQMTFEADETRESGNVVGSSLQHITDVKKDLWRHATDTHQRNNAVEGSNHSVSRPSEPKISDFPNDESSKSEIRVSSRSPKGIADKSLVSSSHGRSSPWETKSQLSLVVQHGTTSSHGSKVTCGLPYNNIKGGGEGSLEQIQTRDLSFHSNNSKMLEQPDHELPCQIVHENAKDQSIPFSNDLEKLATSWSLPVEYLTKVLASISDLPQVKNYPSDSLKGGELEAENINHSCQAATVGFRRRCLEFETLETQRTALGSHMSTHKLTDLSSANPSGMAFSSSLIASNREPVSSNNNHVQYRSNESQSGTNMWDSGIHTFSNLNVLPPYKSIPNPYTPSDKSYLPAQQNEITNSQVAGPGLSSQVKPTCFRLLDPDLGCSFPAMMPSGAENSRTSSILPFSGRNPSLRGVQAMQGSSENQQNLLPSRDLMQSEYSGHLDQELLRSLAFRARMIQHSLLLANNGAHMETARPNSFYPPMELGINPMEQNSDLDCGPTPFMDNSVALQDTSHQSESDHQEDSTHSPRSPRKKRKLLTGDNTGEGCKNCKCKKSKCLKLYCECFAAGVYCIDICNCHDCYNKPEFEETVLGTRQQIESRNPLAFLPKIIRASDASPTLGEESNETPASARHKKGCHCKKSQCLKKYCECYQAGVGCADGCRCEGCKNIYGRNEGSGELEDKDQQNPTSDMKIATNDESISMDQKQSPDPMNEHQGRDLCPITPYLETSGQSRSDMDLGSATSLISPLQHPVPIVSLHSPSGLLELLDETENFAHVNLQPYQTAYTNVVPNQNRQLSPGWDRQAEIYTPTPPPRPLQRLVPISTDGLLLNKSNACDQLWGQIQDSTSHVGAYGSTFTKPDTSHSDVINPIVPLNISPDTTHFDTSENVLAVPGTPMLSSTYAARQNYNNEDLSESRSYQSVWFTDEDDSPTVLKELNTFCAPNIIMKTRSPQQKRIFSYQQSLGSRTNLSPGLGLKTARKFILQALPPPSSSGKP